MRRDMGAWERALLLELGMVFMGFSLFSLSAEIELN